MANYLFNEGFGETSPNHEFSVENSSLCSPNSNFTFSNDQKLEILHTKIDNCGKFSQEFVNKITGEITTFPIYCNNRACENPNCQEHRQYLFMRNHQPQIRFINKNMRKPRSWVFTGWKFPAWTDQAREFCQNKFTYLNQLLKKFSNSEFSSHMEVKPKDDGNYFYVHFHVAGTTFRDLRLLRKLWGRQIRNEEAIRPKDLSYYVSKYAGKTPKFKDEYQREHYHLIAYKTQMHRFSVPLSKCEDPHYFSQFSPMDLLIWEVKRELMKDSYLNPNSQKKRYYEFLERDPPPSPQTKIEFFCN